MPTPQQGPVGPARVPRRGPVARIRWAKVDRLFAGGVLETPAGLTAALTEIRTCQDLHLTHPEPDLYALAVLAYHRHRLEPADCRGVVGSARGAVGHLYLLALYRPGAQRRRDREQLPRYLVHQ